MMVTFNEGSLLFASAAAEGPPAPPPMTIISFVIEFPLFTESSITPEHVYGQYDPMASRRFDTESIAGMNTTTVKRYKQGICRFFFRHERRRGAQFLSCNEEKKCEGWGIVNHKHFPDHDRSGISGLFLCRSSVHNQTDTDGDHDETENLAHCQDCCHKA